MLFWIIELKSLSQSLVVRSSAHLPSEFLLVKILLIKGVAEKAFLNPFSTVLPRYLFFFLGTEFKLCELVLNYGRGL